jgi:hypothetical protein
MFQLDSRLICAFAILFDFGKLSANIVMHYFRQLECEGHQAQDHRDWKDEVHAPRGSQVQEQLQRRYLTFTSRLLIFICSI